MSLGKTSIMNFKKRTYPIPINPLITSAAHIVKPSG